MSTSHDAVFLENARLGPRSPVLIEFDEKAQFPRLGRLYASYALVDLAHAIMMIETGTVEEAGGRELVRGLLEVLDLGPAGFPWLEASNSFLVHVEHFLAETVGEDVAGLLQTARSRNDQDAAAERLFQRDFLLGLAGEVAGLIAIVLDQAEAHSDTVMPGYTHFQHAQPWTFGHYLMRQASILQRDFDRLRGAFQRTNLSALGGAANAGTSWPIDRRRTAALLGHDGLVVNSCDAGEFARDYIEENTGAIALVAANAGRFATDLYVWHSWEFGFVEVADGLAGTSSIMPQKKNPHALERIKAIGGQAIGWMATVMGNQRPAMSMDLDYAFGDDLFGRYAEVTHGSLRLLQESVRTLIVHKTRMAETAGIFWSTTSHLADELVRRYRITFRQSHQIVATFVRLAVEADAKPHDANAEMLVRAGRDAAGLDIAIPTDELRRILDARTFVDTRTSEGSVSPVEVRKHIAASRDELAERLTWLETQRSRAAQATGELVRLARSMAGPA